MQLPIEPKALFNVIDSVQQAREESISVSVYLDDTAPAELVAHVRSSFASASAHARITLSYLEYTHHAIEQKDDMVVIVAGESEKIGSASAQVRNADIPVMIVACDGNAVAARAESLGCAIPEADLIYPKAKEKALAEPAEELAASRSEILSDVVSHKFEFLEKPKPAMLDEEALASIDIQMGEWIAATCSAKKLAFALAFPFVRRPLSLDSVNVTAIENGVIGALVFIPGADMPIMTINQIKMLLQIAAAYGQTISMKRAKELLCVLGSAFFFRSVSRSLSGAIPLIGPVVKAAVGYGGTIAIGRAAIEYFEGGGGIIGLGKTVGRARDAAVKAFLKSKGAEVEPEPEPQTISEKASKSAQVWGDRAVKVANIASTVAGPLLSGAATVGADTLKGGLSSIAHLSR